MIMWAATTVSKATATMSIKQTIHYTKYSSRLRFVECIWALWGLPCSPASLYRKLVYPEIIKHLKCMICHMIVYIHLFLCKFSNFWWLFGGFEVNFLPVRTPMTSWWRSSLAITPFTQPTLEIPKIYSYFLLTYTPKLPIKEKQVK